MIKPKNITPANPETAVLSAGVIANILCKNSISLPQDSSFKTVLSMIGRGLYTPSCEEAMMIEVITMRANKRPSKKAFIMKAAWAIAKAAAKKFGGKAKDFLSQAMKMAWANVNLFITI